MLKKFFAPGINSAFANLALLVLRVWIGLEMALLHGWDKLSHFDKYAAHFVSLPGLNASTSLALSLFAEFFCSLMLVFGILTRFAALVLAINMTVAFIMAHHGQLAGEHSGELAFVYLLIYVTIFIGGPGKVSVDKFLFGSSAAR
jgi:putative oxidoreductase